MGAEPFDGWECVTNHGWSGGAVAHDEGASGATETADRGEILWECGCGVGAEGYGNWSSDGDSESLGKVGVEG